MADTLFAPCKINLYLEVLGKRAEDGYHELVMVMVPLELGDELTFERSERVGIELTCDDPRVPTGDTNLVHKAAREFEKERGRDRIGFGLKCRIAKRSPVAGGVGGGSSDAAAALLAMNRLEGEPLDAGALHRAAARVGADVPFFLNPRPSLIEGVGDIVHPLDGVPALPVLLVNPGKPLATPAVYKGLARPAEPRPALLARKTPERLQKLADGLRRDPVSILRNDLEPVSIGILPEIAEIKVRILDAGARAALMSGSGPTVFGIFDSDRAVRAAVAALKAPPAWTVHPTRTVGSCDR